MHSFLRSPQAQPPVEHPLMGADRLVVLHNPVSSHAHTIGERLVELQRDRHGVLERHGITSVEIDETSADHATNVARLHQLAPNDAVAVAGGDGTVSDIFTAGLEVPLRFPISAFAGGNANDIPHMLYGQRRVNNPEKIIRDARAALVRPLRILVQPPYAAPHWHTAFGYFGMGLTARLAEAFNNNAFRNRVQGKPDVFRLGYEAAEIFRHIKSNTTYGLRGEAAGEYSEIVFMNGQRMAKTLRSRHRLTADGARYERVQGVSVTNLIAGISRLAVGASAELERTDREGYIIQKRGGITAQVDGESFTVADNSYVQVSIAKQALSVTTTRK